MNLKFKNALVDIIEYLEKEELKHYEETNKPKGHIYEKIIILKENINSYYPNWFNLK